METHVMKSLPHVDCTEAPADPRSGPGFISWLGTFVRQAVKRRVERRRMRLCIADLRGLDNRMLADIGIGRSEIEYMVSHGREAGHRRMI